MSESTESIIMCRDCWEETRPTTPEAMRELACIERLVDTTTFWDCPRCEKTIYVLYDHGYIEFGIPSSEEGNDEVAT